MCTVIRHFSELIFGIINSWWVQLFRYRCQLFTLISNPLGICNDYLVPLFGRKIVKFLHHFLSRTEVQRGLSFGIFKALPSQQDTAVEVVLWSEEVYVTCCDHGLV